MIEATLTRDGNGCYHVKLTLDGCRVHCQAASWEQGWEMFKHLTDPYLRNRPAFTLPPLVTAAGQTVIEAPEPEA